MKLLLRFTLLFIVAFLFSAESPASGTLRKSKTIERYAYEAQRDTLYYLTFLDLLEKGEYRYTIKNNNEIVNEKKDIDKQVKRKLGKSLITLIPDSCWNSILTDSVIRRDEKGLEKYCNRCNINSKLMVVDATWVYLSDKEFRSLPKPMYYHNMNQNESDVIGTWWVVRVLIFDPRQKKVIYNHVDKYTQYHNVKPVKKLPGFSHRRFFNRSLKKAKQFLITFKE